MATYESVSWQSGDEVTSVKLDQMAKNGEWLKDNMIMGRAIRSNNGDLTPSPLNTGSSPIKRIDAVVKPFNSGVSTAWMDIDVNIPSGYTNLPIVIHSMGGDPNDYLDSVIYRYNGTKSVTFRISQSDHIAKVLNGNIHVLFIGY